MKYWDRAWSLVDGCSPVSPACDNCWLMNMVRRFNMELIEQYQDDGIWKEHWSGKIFLADHRLDIPMKIRKPTVFAVWSDLFHPDVPADFIIEAFEVMEHCEQHIFLVLTKRPERMNSVLYGQEGNFYLGGGDYMPNVWLGTTIESQDIADKRIPELLKCEPFNLFLSVEPMLGAIDLSGVLGKGPFYDGITQIICGGETGGNARPMHPDWVRSLRDQCVAAEVPFFFKGWGAWQPVEHIDGIKEGDICLSEDGFYETDMVYFANESGDVHMRRSRKPGHLLDGREWNELAWEKK